MIGFKMNEIMVGTHRFEGSDEELPMLFHLTWGHRSLRAYCSPFSPDFLRADAKGIITVGGLVHKAECEGSLHLLYFTEQKVRYELAFEDGQGKAYRYVGEKVDIRPWNLHKSHTTCYGTITECGTGKVVSRSVVHFPLSELLTFLKSHRFVFSEGCGREKAPVPTPESPKGGRRRVLSSREAGILAAMAGAIIPRGGESFRIGAADLEEKWLPRIDYIMSRMPLLTRLGFRLTFHILNRVLPFLFLKRRAQLVDLDEFERTRLFRMMEGSAFPGPLAVLLTKVLVFPAFYGLPEAKQAIGYEERFPNPQFEGLKD